VCRFVLIYALLILPWPGVRQVYGAFFRGVGQVVFGWEKSLLDVSFNASEGGASSFLDTRIVIVDPALMHADGSGPVRNLDVHTGDFWTSVALLVALILATPVSWRRRRRALLWGLLWEQLSIILFLGLQIWDEASYLSPKAFSPIHWVMAGGMKEGLIEQARLAVPVLIWLIVTFRKEDRLGEIGRLALGKTAKAS
jgi:hypothetical protein